MITPEMIKAGVRAYCVADERVQSDEDIVAEIYAAMRALEPPHPGYRLPEEWEPQ